MYLPKVQTTRNQVVRALVSTATTVAFVPAPAVHAPATATVVVALLVDATKSIALQDQY